MHVDLNSNMGSNFNTDGRTDGTKNITRSDSAIPCNARGNESEPTLIGDLVEPANWLRTSERHPVVRQGERREIEPHTRAAVRLRDRGRCELCGWKYVDGEWHLDHITPWSAGGSDRSENLRVLCAEHNRQRSNHVDTLERPRRPVTWWCINCYGNGSRWWYGEEFGVICGAHQYRFCQVKRAYQWAKEEFGEWPDWHKRRPVEAGPLTAFCAHCNAPAATDVTL